ncbi:MAG: hypothetical protein BWY10_02644 [Chloroflexi bacterium ADurb.Bin180]|nr:MAG: hypothetical protein BWY10_02644 [Chloroflexi bacterium ADurb.Bin180]
MSDGHRTSGQQIDYKELRKISPQAARQAVISYWQHKASSIAEVARTCEVNRCVVYDILRKWSEGDLRDRAKTPRHQPRRTPAEREAQVIAAKNQTHLGPQRLFRYLQRYEQVIVSTGTIRHILARNKERLTGPVAPRHRPQEARPFVDWYSARPFEIVQMDLKFIRDRKALSRAQIVFTVDHGEEFGDRS